MFDRRLVLPEIARGGWIVLTYRDRPTARPRRPMLRLIRADGVQDVVLPGVAQARTHWLGLLPGDVREIRLAAEPGFVLERVGRRSEASLVLQCLRLRPWRAVSALYERIRGDERRYRDTLRGACAVTPRARYSDWADMRRDLPPPAAGGGEGSPVAIRVLILPDRDPTALAATLASLRSQTCERWQAMVLHTGATSAFDDPRIASPPKPCRRGAKSPASSPGSFAPPRSRPPVPRPEGLIKMTTPLSRRTLLRGLGTTLALPWLDAMTPLTRAADAVAATTPRRMAFFYVPNGMHMPLWTPPGGGGPLGDLPAILQPLAGMRDQINLLTGLTADGARPHGDGAGDHARSMTTFLTGIHPRKTAGLGLKAGVSVDQVAAQHLGRGAKLPSIELGIDRGAPAGNCDSGYSCAYSANLSWRSESTPMGKEVDPRLAFERLFADRLRPNESAQARASRERSRRSVLDFVADDAKALQGKLGVDDRRKVDEYLSSVRDLEARMAQVDTKPQVDLAGVRKPTGVPRENREHIALMLDVLALAFRTDSTRVATFSFANEGSTKSYKFLGVPEGHHDLSHHGRDPGKQAKVAKINTYHIEMFASFLHKLQTAREGAGTVLDQCSIVYGSGISDGDRHNHDDLPILVAGRGGGTIRTGQHLVYPADTPLNNLYLTLLAHHAISPGKLGDASGILPGLTVA